MSISLSFLIGDGWPIKQLIIRKSLVPVKTTVTVDVSVEEEEEEEEEEKGEETVALVNVSSFSYWSIHPGVEVKYHLGNVAGERRYSGIVISNDHCLQLLRTQPISRIIDWA